MKTEWRVIMSFLKGKDISGVTTFGDEVKSHIAVINEEYEAYENLLEFLHTSLRSVKNWRAKKFMYVCMNVFCREGVLLVPAEFSVTVFSFHAGVVETVSGFIDPDRVPFGETSEVKMACAETALPYPGRFGTEGLPSYLRFTSGKFVEKMLELSKRYELTIGGDILMFATRADGPMISSCIEWIRAKSGTPLKFRVSRMEVLLMQMSRMGANEYADRKSGVIEHEGGAGRFIFNTRYDFKTSLGCDWHKQDEHEGKVDKCAKSLSSRRVYNSLYYLCKLYGTPLRKTTHVPN